jgi:DNA (cytosine-5)-methyltransferase 1
MNELHLFAGAGGGIYGGQLLGHTTVCAVEIESYCRQVMHQRQRDGVFPKFPIWDDVTTFDGRPWKGSVDIIAGGFPCQDISAAGKGAGLAGKRSGLWAEFARIIGEIQPRFAFIENSPLLRTRGLVTVLQDLAQMGYDARWCVLGAWHAGAPHKRDRMWILAYPNGIAIREQHRGSSRESGEKSTKPELYGENEQLANTYTPGLERSKRSRGADSERRQIANGPATKRRCVWWHQDPAEMADTSSNGERGLPIRPGRPLEKEVDADGAGQEMADAEHHRRERCKSSERRRETLFKDGSFTGRNSENELHQSEESRPTKPLLGRVAHGVANRRKRLAAIGNGQVPQCAAMAFNILSKGLI